MQLYTVMVIIQFWGALSVLLVLYLTVLFLIAYVVIMAASYV